MTPIQTSFLSSASAEAPLIADIACAFKKTYPDLEEIHRLLTLCQPLPEGTRAAIRQEIDSIEQEKCAADPHRYRSILECLISERHFDAAIALIKLNVASIKQANQHYPYTSTGMTPLHLAAKEHSLPVVKALIEAGSDADPVAISISAKSSQFPDDPCYATTPLSCWLEGIAKSDHTQSEVLDYLLSRGADVNRAYLHRKPFISACIVKGQEQIALQVVNRVDLHAIDRIVAANVPRYHDQTPLYLAAREGMVKLVNALIGLKVELQAYSSESPMSPSMYTALHVATFRDNEEIVAALLKAGADPNKKAINSAYGKELPFIENRAPLTSWQWAVDLHRPGCDRKVIESFKKYSRAAFSQELPENPGEPTKPNDLWYGKYSLPLRLITEEVRTRGPIPKLPFSLRCFCPDDEKIPAIRACFERLQSRKSRLWTPIINALESFSERDPEHGIFFLPKDQSLHKLGVCGTYNAETGHIITIDSNWTFEHYDPAAVLIHETTHKMAHHIFKTGSCEPIKGIESHKNYYEALQKDIALISNANWDGFPQQVKETLQEAVSGDKEKHASEVIARIPEAAYLLSRFGLSEEEIHQKLEKLLPHIFPLYLSEFIPACEKLAQKQAFP